MTPRKTFTIHDENVDRIGASLDRIAARILVVVAVLGFIAGILLGRAA
jgi:hypothetical protein